MRILAIDTETCAVGRDDRIVQFCAIELDEHLQERGRWTQLVHPGRSIPFWATAIHRIRDRDVADKPPFQAVAGRLRRLLDGAVLMAYNVPFDAAILDREFRRVGERGLQPDHIVLDPLRWEARGRPRNLGAVYARYMGHPLHNAHDAQADTEAMIEILRHQRRLQVPPVPPRLEDMLRPLNRPRRSHRPARPLARNQTIHPS